MSKDYIPAKEDVFVPWANSYVANVATVMTALTLPTTFDDALVAAKTAFDAARTAHIAAQIDARNKRTAKDVALANYKKEIRRCTNQLQANPALTNAQRATLGVTIPDTVPTPIAAPTDTPILTIDFSNRGEHIVNFQNSAGGSSKGKPEGVHGCAVYRKISATQPTGISTMEYVGTYTRSGGRLVYEESQYGQQVFYVGFWETAKGLRGPQGDFTNATISK